MGWWQCCWKFTELILPDMESYIWATACIRNSYLLAYKSPSERIHTKLTEHFIYWVFSLVSSFFKINLSHSLFLMTSQNFAIISLPGFLI